MTELHRSCRFAMQTQILHCKMLSKVLRKICFAEQNNCYAKFQTAIHTCILHSTNCSAKKMTGFDPWGDPFRVGGKQQTEWKVEMTFYRIFWWRFLEDKSRFFEGLSLIAFDGVTWCGIREKTDFLASHFYATRM